MSHSRHPAYMRRRFMRVLADEQRRQQELQFRKAVAEQERALLLLRQQICGSAPLADAFDDASAADGQAAVLRRGLH